MLKQLLLLVFNSPTNTDEDEDYQYWGLQVMQNFHQIMQ